MAKNLSREENRTIYMNLAYWKIVAKLNDIQSNWYLDFHDLLLTINALKFQLNVYFGWRNELR